MSIARTIPLDWPADSPACILYIADTVALYAQIPIGDILASPKGYSRRVQNLRSLTAFFARQLLHATWGEIGAALNCQASTALRMYRRVCESDPVMRHRVTEMRRLFP